MGELVNGVDPKAKLLDDLLKATKENIEETTEQNKKLGRYTFWIVIMTIVITICTFIQTFR